MLNTNVKHQRWVPSPGNDNLTSAVNGVYLNNNEDVEWHGHYSEHAPYTFICTGYTIRKKNNASD